MKPTAREWDEEILKRIKEENNQPSLFDDCKKEIKLVKKEIKLVKKLPYKFSYKFEDNESKQSTLMIEDWEIGQLYWNCLKKRKNEKEAIQDIMKKYKDEFLNKKDIYFFLGTTKEFHIRKVRNPYVIIGIFYPPKSNQETLF